MVATEMVRTAAGSEAAAQLGAYLDASGLSRPTEQVMVVAPPLPCLPLVLAAYTLGTLSKMVWSAPLAALVPGTKMGDEAIDGVPTGIDAPGLRLRPHGTGGVLQQTRTRIGRGGAVAATHRRARRSAVDMWRRRLQTSSARPATARSG